MRLTASSICGIVLDIWLLSYRVFVACDSGIWFWFTEYFVVNDLGILFWVTEYLCYVVLVYNVELRNICGMISWCMIWVTEYLWHVILLYGVLCLLIGVLWWIISLKRWFAKFQQQGFLVNTLHKTNQMYWKVLSVAGCKLLAGFSGGNTTRGLSRGWDCDQNAACSLGVTGSESHGFSHPGVATCGCTTDWLVAVSRKDPPRFTDKTLRSGRKISATYPTPLPVSASRRARHQTMSVRRLELDSLQVTKCCNVNMFPKSRNNRPV